MFTRTLVDGAVAVTIICCASANAQKLYWSNGYDARGLSRANLDASEQEWVVRGNFGEPESLVLDLARGKIYWSDSDLPAIKRANLDGSAIETVLRAELTEPTSIAFDPIRDRIYWLDQGDWKIRRAFSNGSQVEELISIEPAFRSGIAFDWDESELYWSEPGENRIRRMNVDTGFIENVVSAPTIDPNDLALDLVAEKIYWIGASFGIARANLDGSNMEEVVSDQHLSHPSRLAIDPLNEKVYWTQDYDIVPALVLRADFDGANVEHLVQGSSPTRGIALDVLAGKMYWTGGGGISGRIARADLDGSNQEQVIRAGFFGAGSLEIDPLAGELFWSRESLLNSTFDVNMQTSALDGGGIADLLFETRVQDIALDVVNRKMYWSEGEGLRARIVRSNYDGTESDTLIDNVIYEPYGIAIDPVGGRLYAADFSFAGGRIVSSTLDGADAEPSIASGVFPRGMAIDSVGQKLYWVDTQFSNVGKVMRANLDGSSPQLLSTNAPSGRYIALDLTHGKIYWTAHFEIYRANLDGSAPQLLLDQFDGVHHVNGIAIDPLGAKMYWCEEDFLNHPAKLRRANLDGSGVEDLFASEGLALTGLALDLSTSMIYWLQQDTDGGGIWQSDLDGLNREQVAETGNAPWGLTIDTMSEQLFWTEPSSGTVRRVTTNGMNSASLLMKSFRRPHGLAVNATQEVLYWVDETRIQGSALEGGIVFEVLDTPQTAYLSHMAVEPLSGWLYLTGYGVWRIDPMNSSIHPVFDEEAFCFDVALDSHAGKVYWTQPNDSVIRRANFDGSQIEDFLLTEFPYALALNPISHIRSSDPADCTIDARQPHDIDDPSVRFGWSSVDLDFSSTLSPPPNPANFEVIEQAGDGLAPNIVSITPVSPNIVRVTLDEPIEPGAWSCINHINSGTKACMGYLPGDVNGDGTSSPIDILRLIDSFNGVVTPRYEVWQTDIDRSGAATPADVLHLIDVLNGADTLEPWLGVALLDCP